MVGQALHRLHYNSYMELLEHVLFPITAIPFTQPGAAEAKHKHLSLHYITPKKNHSVVLNVHTCLLNGNECDTRPARKRQQATGLINEVPSKLIT